VSEVGVGEDLREKPQKARAQWSQGGGGAREGEGLAEPGQKGGGSH
jgi:hypothetical protein